MRQINKKGVAVKTLVLLIIGVAIIIAVILLTLSFLGFLSPTSAGLLCGANVRIKAASPIQGLVSLPLCKMYQTPIKIDGTDFKKCPGLDLNICDGSSGVLRDACEQQCVRIQIDSYTDACWSIAGSNNYELMGPGQRVGYNLAVLRCFSFQVVAPTRTHDRLDWKVSDDSKGDSSYYYALTASHYSTDGAALITACTNLRSSVGDNNLCRLGGGVKAIVPGEISSLRHEDLNYWAPELFDLCYISYIEDESGPYRDGYVVRSCSDWTKFATRTTYLPLN